MGGYFRAGYYHSGYFRAGYYRGHGAGGVYTPSRRRFRPLGAARRSGPERVERRARPVGGPRTVRPEAS